MLTLLNTIARKTLPSPLHPTLHLLALILALTFIDSSIYTTCPITPRYRGGSNHLITIITTYRVCQTARSGPLTAYEQQRRYLITQTNALHPNPRQSMLMDLQSFIQSQVGQTHHILLMLDANSTLHDPDIQAFMRACQLHNL